MDNDLTPSDLCVTVFGEIVSGKGFNCSYPISVHLYIELPKNWKTHGSNEPDEPGISTHCSKVTKEGVAHFSHPFFNQFVMTGKDSAEDTEVSERYVRPLLLFSVVGTNGKLLRDEGFAMEPLPAHPGNYILNLTTWKPSSGNVSDKMKDLFLGIGPSLQDPRTVLSPSHAQGSHRFNLFGFETEGSGTLQIRLRIVHQSATGNTTENTGSQELLLERMSSSDGILRSVQAVIEAFQKARRQAVAANNPNAAS